MIGMAIHRASQETPETESARRTGPGTPGRSWKARGWRTVMVVAAVLATVSLGHPMLLGGLGGYLITEHPVGPADAIVILGGGTPFRALEAARLYRQGMGRLVVVTRGVRWPDFLALERLGFPMAEERDYNRAILRRSGVPPQAIRVLDRETENTFGELISVREVFEREQIRSAIIVTSRVHSTRAFKLWSYVMGGTVAARIRTTPEEEFDPNGWWRTRGHIQRVLHEYLGLMNYWLGQPL